MKFKKCISIAAISALCIANAIPVLADKKLKAQTEDTEVTTEEKVEEAVEESIEESVKAEDAEEEAVEEASEDVKQTIPAAVTKSEYYTDVNDRSYPWAIPYIDDISKRGIAHGVGDNKFAPSNDIERGDFFIFVDKTFALKAASGEIFDISDVKPTDYYYQSIINAKVAGIIDFIGPVYPETPITRSDAFLYIYRALNKAGMVGNNTSVDLSMYNDGALVTNAEKELAIGSLTKMGIVEGDNGNIKPETTLSRAEMAVIFSKVCSYLDDNKIENDNKKPVVDDGNDDEENTSKSVYEDEILTSPIEATDEDIRINDSELNVTGKTGVTLNGGNLEISSSRISTQNSDGVHIKDADSATLEDSIITAKNGNAVVIEGKSDVDVTGGTYKASTELEEHACFNIKSGDLSIEGTARIEGDGVYAIKMENDAKLNIAKGSKISSNFKNGTIYIYDEDPELLDKVNSDKTNNANDSKFATINITGGEVTNSAKNGCVFKIQDANVEFNFTNGEIKGNKIIDMPVSLRTKQDVGSNIKINLENENMEGDIVLDDTTTLNLYIGEKASYTGTVNGDKLSSFCDITIDNDGTLELTGESRFRKFVMENEETTFNNIKAQGAIIYYDSHDDANDYLKGETYNLPYGGELRPW